MAQFEHQSLANTLWAFATMAEKDRPLFDAIAAKAVPTIPTLTHQDLSNSAWAFAPI
eukprot:CAMPEP_0168710734 /NCGR_PEP_ID=MMETSP0503-20121227/42796_1 /TAXON_ID=89963 /ORGANISM="Heterocapsa rotundata, Strain SCCAP K-0483" /LENGTH=56 /DNA_ID=CAMNT_0008757087 /DNA_START=9 /DNA_END=176 /DNA_ORIENTATION=-